MSNMIQSKFPREVKAGDQFVNPDDGSLVWTALHDAKVLNREVHIDVQFALDGGCSTRVWDNDSDFTFIVVTKADDD